MGVRAISDLYGNLDGLKADQLNLIEGLYRRRVAQDEFITPEIARRLAELSRGVNRQIGLLVDRLGQIQKVIVGDAHQIFIPDLGRSRAGKGRLRGLRLLVTHLRGEPLNKDNLTDLSLLRLDSVVVLQVDVKGLPGAVEVAYLLPPNHPSNEMWKVDLYHSVFKWEGHYLDFITELESEMARAMKLEEADGRPKAILLGVAPKAKEGRLSIDELERLAETAGLSVVEKVLQVKRQPDGRTYVGRGKLKEVVLRSMNQGAEVLVFDGELSPSQLRNVATDTNLKVLDRTQLILDIFAQRATTREGKLQVELAQLRYRKPRLALMPTAMSRLTGGIGGRGPGETKLEVNRRRADERLKRISTKLKKLGRDRALRRSRRKRVGLPLVSIVGYTNAGKSTLLNKMTRSKVDAEDKLFATLDPTSRRMRFPREREVILTDTVGFIRALPKELVEAFRSTLEEVVEADLLLHVVDSTSEEAVEHIEAVEKVLDDLGAGGTPVIRVLNKVDSLPLDRWDEVKGELQGRLVSAHSGEGLEGLLHAVQEQLFHIQATDQGCAESQSE